MNKRFIAYFMACVLFITSIVFAIPSSSMTASASENDGTEYCNVIVRRIAKEGDSVLSTDEFLFKVQENQKLEIPDWFLPDFADGHSAAWSAREVSATLFNAARTPATMGNATSGNEVPDIIVTGDSWYDVTWDVSWISDENISVTINGTEVAGRFDQSDMCRILMKDGSIVYRGYFDPWSHLNDGRLEMYAVSTISEFPKYVLNEEKGYKVAGFYVSDSTNQSVRIDSDTDLSAYATEDTHGKKLSVNVVRYGRVLDYVRVTFKILGTSENVEDVTYYGFLDPEKQKLSDIAPSVSNPGHELVGWSKTSPFADTEDKTYYNSWFGVDGYADTVTIENPESTDLYESVRNDSTVTLYAVWKDYNYRATTYRAPVNDDVVIDGAFHAGSYAPVYFYTGNTGTHAYELKGHEIYGNGQIGDKIGDVLSDMLTEYINADNYCRFPYEVSFNPPEAVPDYTASPSMAPYTGVLKSEVTQSEYNEWSYYAGKFKMGKYYKFYLDEECTIPMTFDTVIAKDMCYPEGGVYNLALYVPSANTTGFNAPQMADCEVEVNSVNFPDETVLEYVTTYLDKDQDGILSIEERNKVKAIRLSDTGVKSLKGMELFPCLTRIVCTGTGILMADLSENHYLNEAYLDNNGYEISEKYIDTATMDGFDISRVSDLDNLTIDGTRLVITDCSKPAHYSYATGWSNITGIEYKPIYTITTTYADATEAPSEETTQAPAETPSEETTTEAPAETPSEEKTTQAPTETPSEETTTEAPAETPGEETTEAATVIEKSDVAFDEDVRLVDENGNDVKEEDIIVAREPVNTPAPGIRNKVAEIMKNVVKDRAKVFYFDISAYVGSVESGNTVKVEGNVTIRINYGDLGEGITSSHDITVLHYDRPLEDVRKYDTYFTFRTDGFSPFTVIAVENTTNAPNDDDDGDDEEVTSQATVVNPTEAAVGTDEATPPSVADTDKESTQNAESVETGDVSPLGMMLVMLILSAMGFMICGFSFKKKRI